MPLWSFRVDDRLGNSMSALRDATGRKLTFALNAAPTFDFATATPVDGLAELDAEIYATRDGTPMFRGRVGPTSDKITATSHDTTWQAVGYEAALLRTPVWPGATVTWTGTDQATIARTLASQAAAATGVDWGLTFPTTTTGRNRDYSVQVGKMVGEAINDLASMIDGFDWSVTPGGEFTVHYPQRGVTSSWDAVLGATVSEIAAAFDPATYATDMLGLGDESLSPVTASAASRPLGRWSAVQSWSDVSVSATLTAHTQGALALAGMSRSWQVQVAPGRWSPGEAWLGDTINLHVESGRFSVHEPQRIVAIDIALDDADQEAVTLTLGRVPATLARRLADLRRRVTNTERA